MSGVTRRSALLTIGAGAGLALTGCSAAPPPSSRPAAVTALRTAAPSSTPSPTAAFDLTARSIDDPASIWIVVNKRRPLRPARYAPADLRAVDVPHTNPPVLRAAAATAVERMVAAAQADHAHMISVSTYRPFDDQRRIFDGDLARLGRAGAEALTLRPGFSEHQTGLAIDLGTSSGACTLAACFGHKAVGRWAAAHAWEHGFLLRYPKPDEHITGIEYEPWHFRYVGPALATHLHEQGITTLERCFGLPDAPTYAA